MPPHPDRLPLVVGALLAMLAVIAGAVGAHGFEMAGDPRAAGLFETAARYQMWHALAIIATAALPLRARVATMLFLAGILLFCGSLYLLAFGTPRRLAWVTPFGGLAFIAGWAALAFAALRTPPPDPRAGG